MLESWRGKPFSEAELSGFNISKLVGVGCQLAVQQSQSNGKTYANVSAVVPLPKGVKASKPQNKVIVFSLANCSAETKLPEDLPGWIKGVIMQSKEWQVTHEILPDSIPEDLTGDNTDDDNIPF
jgi:hypothetical protein